MTLRIHLLGPAQVSRDDVPVNIPGNRPLALLAYLLVTGKAHSRQHLVDLLFDGPEDPRAALRWTLSKLRKATGADYILADRQQIAFNEESDYWLDVTGFEGGQLDLYRGDFLEGLHLREAFAFEDWLIFERERLRGSYQAALEQQLLEVESRGDDLAIIETAHELLRLDNLREDWYRALMRAYARQGKREAALAQYNQCRQVLQAELGVDPITETVNLAEAIRQGDIRPGQPSAGATIRKVRLASKTISHPRFLTSLVGRTTEMETLRQVWRKVVEGHGQIVLVEGEPGIGKTRLLEELLVEVAEQAVILRTKCPELQDPLAYTLFVDALRQALGEEHPPELSDTWLAEVSRLLPELRDRYPNLPQPDFLDPAAERRRLFDAVCATLLALTVQHPLVLFEDDLQWADATSLELLNHLSGRITEAPVLILGTYRSNEVGPDHPLQRPRRDWQRAGLLTELSLEALSDEAVVGLLQELTTWPGDDRSFGELVYRETAGNPLFVVETIASLRDEGRLPQDAEAWQRDFRAESVTIPAQVQTLIETRLNRLDELSRQVGTTAAVMRGSFTAEVVQVVSGRNEWETLEGLEQLLEVGLLVEQGAEQFSFSHDKIREVAYHSLSQLRRKLLHRRVAETLEKGHRGREDTIADRLAHHYERAGVSDKALAYHTRAGDRAREQYAHETAIDHYQKVLTYLKAQEDYDSAARLLMKLGLLYHNIFDFQQARQAYEEGFDLRQKAGEVQPATLPPAPHALRLVMSNPPTLDPAMAADTVSGIIISQLFSRLVTLSPDLDVIPDIAKSWEVLGGGSSYLFHLRDDMRWNDGVPLTAEDFAYAWRRVLNPATNSPNAGYFSDIKGARAFHQGQLTDPDQVGIRAFDPLTLLVELEAPTGHFPQLLTYSAFCPIPQHIVEAQGRAWTEKQPLVTNGPFQLEALQQGQSMVLSRNPEYRGRFTGNVERVELSLNVTSPAEELAMYEANQLDLISLSPSPEADHIRQQRAEEYFSEPWLDTQYTLFNMREAPFNDPRVRRAFALAIDKETLVNVVLRGFDLPANGGVVPLGMPGHSPGIGLPYNPEQARQLLAEAGYPGGQNFPVFECLARSDHYEAVIVEHLQRQWREILGVEIGRRAVEWGTKIDQLEQGLFHLALDGWLMDYPDPDNILRVATVSRNWAGWRNETYIALVEQARRITNHAERMELYRQADKILIEDAPSVPLTYSQRHFLVKPWVRRFSPSAIVRSFWQDIIIEPHGEIRQVRRVDEESPALRQPASAGGSSTLPPAPHALRTTAEGEPDTLDPTLCNDSTSAVIIDQLFRGLVTETHGMEFVPDVAQRWEILEDGRKYIFHLRSDVVWSDGVPVTATDFEYAWKRVLNPATGPTEAHLLYDLKGASAFHQGQVSNPDSIGVSTLDKHTLAVELERPASYFLNLLTHPTTFPVPQHVVEMHGEAWTEVEKIVTNGPFKLEVWRKGEVMGLRRSRTYHGPFRGNVERVEVFFSGDDLATELAWYEAGRLDVARLPPLKRETKQQHGGEYITRPTLRTYVLGFDKSHPPFDDPRVRQALILASDRPGLRDTFTEIYGIPATGGLCPPGMPGHSAGIGLPYDPVQARQLLAEAGYPEGHNFPEIDWLMAEFLKPLAGYLQEQWQTNLGIHLFNKKSASWGTLFERTQQEQPALLLWGWVADYPDPDNFLRVCLQHLLPGWRNETFERLVEQAGRMTDQRKRIELYQQADKILIEDAVLMPLTYGRYPLLIKPWVKQLVYAPHRRVFWQYVIIEPHDETRQARGVDEESDTLRKTVRTSQPTTLLPAPQALRLVSGDPPTLDSTMSSDLSASTIIDQLFSGLVEQRPEMEVVPDIAQSWQMSADGRKYIFHLRDDVRWSDGVPVTAEDFEYAWKRVLDPTLGSPSASLLYDIEGARAFHQGNLSDSDQVGVRALDKITLEVELGEPTSYFPQLLAHSVTYPLPRHVVEAHGQAWTEVGHIVTNGPFRLEAWQRGKSMILGRNPEYRGRFTGNVQRVELRLGVAPSAELELYEAGGLDIDRSLWKLPASEIARARQRHADEHISQSCLDTQYIGFDVSRPPFDDSRVRQAFVLSVDRERLVDVAYGGHHSPATGGFIPGGMPGHSVGLGLPYDPDRARRLLAEAGYPQGRGFPGVEWLTTPIPKAMFEYVQAQWRENLGIEIEWQTTEWGMLLERLNQEPPHLFQGGWTADYPDPDNFLRTSSIRRVTRWRNKAYDSLVNGAKRVTDRAERMKLYRQADSILIEEAVVLPLLYQQIHMLLKPWVSKFPTSPIKNWFWKDVIIERH